MYLLKAVCALVAAFPLFARSEVFDLSDLKWNLKNENGSISIPASIPSQAHLDLLKAGIITEPLLGINGQLRNAISIVKLVAHVRALPLDFTQRWIINDNWTYTADLRPLFSQISKQKARTLLVFYGIDTIANIVSRVALTRCRAALTRRRQLLAIRWLG